MASCANCGATTEALKACAQCAEGMDVNGNPTPGVRYCDVACQEQHWDQHKLGCIGAKYRKQLFRAGELVQEVFYDLRRQTFDLPVGPGAGKTEAETKNNILYVYERPYRPEEQKTKICVFPSAIFATETDQQKMLTLDGCDYTLTRMLRLTELALKGAYKKLEGVRMAGFAHHMRIVMRGMSYGADEVERLHEVLKVTLKDGNQYAFDLSGAQYGHHQTVMLWSQYVQKLRPIILKKVAPGAFALAHERLYNGVIARYTKKEDKRAETVMIDTRNMAVMVHGWVSRFFIAEINECVREEETPLHEALRASTNAYTQFRAAFTARFSNHLGDFVAWLKKPKSVDILISVPQTQYGDGVALPEFCDAEVVRMLAKVAPASRLHLEGSVEEKEVREEFECIRNEYLAAGVCGEDWVP